jgi:ABC-type polysaccharide/polyol phosphate transport system ATPase subunit
MSQSAIVVENLSKRYLIGHRLASGGKYKYTALRDVIGRETRNFARKALDVVRGRQVVQGDEIEEFWALRNVNFEVKQGEILGIIGRNGAGKSTLLKILSRITEPTEGRVSLRGRIASLLEVGTGFHPELTGRENVFLNGAILGMTQREIRKKFDEIVAFAEVEKFLDTPVKHYSSGMYVRLAFAVAAHLEPEILIVDEVLAVGDAEFQKKCLGKMDEVSRGQGRTILIVSHNMGVTTSLCKRALWLEQGSVRENGRPEAVVGHYLARATLSHDRLVRLDQITREPWLSDDRLRFLCLEWLSSLPQKNGEQATLRLHFETRAPLSCVSVLVGFNAPGGTRVLSYHMNQNSARRDLALPGRHSVDLIIDPLILGPEIYNINVVCRSGDFHILDAVDCGQVEVVAGPSTPASFTDRFLGVRVEGIWSWHLTRHQSERDFIL